MCRCWFFVFLSSFKFSDKPMVQSIQNIGHVMGLKTIAEWVEDEATLQLLRDMNVDYAQGFWLARPQQLDEIN